MKKKFFGFLTAILTLGVLGGTAFVAASDNIQKEEPAYAATMTGGEVLYLDAHSWSGARYAAYFYDGSNNNTWVDMSKVFGNLYSVSAPTGNWTNLIFCRMNGSTTTNNWDNRWNQTGNLTYDGAKNLFTVSQWDGQTSGWGNLNVYLIGSFNSWTTKDQNYLFNNTNNSFSLKITLKNGDQLKINDGTWNNSIGGSDFSSTSGVNFDVNGDGNLVLNDTGENEYIISLIGNSKATIEHYIPTDKEVVDEFVATYMHMTDITHNPNDNDTEACKGDKGYYALAKQAFEGLTADQKELFATGGDYANAWARLNAWAKANGEKINDEYEFVKPSNVTFLVQNNNLYVFIIIAIGAISLVVLFYAIKRKRQTI